jgi:hypothetical protein
MTRLTLVVGLLGILLATAFGQGKLMQADIPFEFVAHDTTLPAGNYEFNVSSNNNSIQIRNTDLGKIVELAVVTRLAADRTAGGTARISFDVQEGKHVIEAIWPVTDDGYLLHTVKGQHTHEIVRSK